MLHQHIKPDLEQWNVLSAEESVKAFEATCFTQCLNMERAHPSSASVTERVRDQFFRQLLPSCRTLASCGWSRSNTCFRMWWLAASLAFPPRLHDKRWVQEQEVLPVQKKKDLFIFTCWFTFGNLTYLFCFWHLEVIIADIPQPLAVMTTSDEIRRLVLVNPKPEGFPALRWWRPVLSAEV